ncbi:MAG: M16 family metallopeptidase [Bacteriovoracia bacterium]
MIYSGCATAPKQIKPDPQPQITSTSSFIKTSTLYGFKVHRYVLGNGLKILILEDHSNPVFAYQTWFNVGSKDEKKGKTGLAHLFEHMMFKKTKNHPDGFYFKKLESIGAEGINAFTGKDYTAYIQSLPAGNSDQRKFSLQIVAELESNRMQNLVLDELALKTELEVVQNERRLRLENNPDGKLYEKLHEVSFEKHSYHWPVIGYEKDLNQTTPADCTEFYDKHYSPNNATIVVSGDVDPNETVSVIEKYYGSISPYLGNQDEKTLEPKQLSQRKKTISIPGSVQKVFISYHIPEFFHEDTSSLLVLRSLLSLGKSSVLYDNLVDPGIASSVAVDLSSSKDPGLLMIYVTLQTGQSVEHCIRIIDREIKKLIKAVPTEDITRAVSQLKLEQMTELQSNYQKAIFLGSYESVTTDFENGIEIFSKAEKITPQEISKSATKYLTSSNRTIVIGKIK